MKAVHFIVGFEHEHRKDGRWNFTRWDLVDVARFEVKLKAEFQGSNRDMYRPEANVSPAKTLNANKLSRVVGDKLLG